MFSVSEGERDAAAVYKFFGEKRPSEVNHDYGLFYLAVNNTPLQKSRF